MKKLFLFVAAAAAFGLTPYAMALEPLVSAGALLVLGVALAVAASGGPSALGVAGGATAAFAGTILGAVSAPAGGAVMVGLAFAERTTRVRGRRAQLAHMGTATVSGALAGALGPAYVGGPPAVHVVAVIVAAVLVVLPLLVEADDPLAHALDGLAGEVGEPSRCALREGAALRRSVEEVPLERGTARDVARTWGALLRLAEARLRLERAQGLRAMATSSPAGASGEAVVALVDRRIRDHVAALTRAYTAVDTASAARVGLDDAALRTTEGAGASLEDVSLALVDVDGADVANPLAPHAPPGGNVS